VLVLISKKKNCSRKRSITKKEAHADSKIYKFPVPGTIETQNAVYNCKYYVVPPHDFWVSW